MMQKLPGRGKHPGSIFTVCYFCRKIATLRAGTRTPPSALPKSGSQFPSGSVVSSGAAFGLMIAQATGFPPCVQQTRIAEPSISSAAGSACVKKALERRSAISSL